MTTYTQNIHDTQSALDALALLELDVVNSLTVYDTTNASKWYLSGNLQPGATQYSDRSYVFSTVPTLLLGAEWIETPIGSRSFTGNPLVTFNVTQPTTVYVAVDTRSGQPGWMDTSWSNSGLVLTDSQSPGYNAFLPFVKTFPPGPVSLGYNTATGLTSRNMYTVMMLPSSYSYAMSMVDPQSAVDTLTKSYKTNPLDALSGLDGVGKNAQKALGDALSGQDSQSKGAQSLRQDATSGLDTQTKTTKRPLSDATSATDALSHTWSAHLALLEAISGSDAVQKAFKRTFFDLFSALDSVLAAKSTGGVHYQQNLADTISSVDVLSLIGITKLLGDAYSALDSRSSGITKQWYDTSSATDTLTRSLTRTLTETYALSDAQARQVARQVVDTVSLVDKVSAGRALLQLLLDQFSALDSAPQTTKIRAPFGLIQLATSLVASALQISVTLTTTIALSLATSLLPSPFQLALALIAPPLAEVPSLLSSPLSMAFSVVY